MLDGWIALLDAGGAAWQQWIGAPGGGQINGLAIASDGALLVAANWSSRGASETMFARLDARAPEPAPTQAPQVMPAELIAP